MDLLIKIIKRLLEPGARKYEFQIFIVELKREFYIKAYTVGEPHNLIRIDIKEEK